VLNDLHVPLPVTPEDEDFRHGPHVPPGAPDSLLGDAYRLAAACRIYRLVRDELMRRQTRAN